MVSQDDIVGKVTSEFKDKVEVKPNPEHRIDIITSDENLTDVANFVKHELGFTHPNMCTGIDQKDHIEVVWHVGNPASPILISIRSTTNRDDSKITSLTPIWQGYNWHERETYDMLGVQFQGHPDLRRLIMPDNWEGHPLKEDYVYKKPKYRKLEDYE